MEHYGIQFKDMDKKQKVKHIWEYYRYHILATIIGIAVVFSVGKTMLFPEPPNEVDIVMAASMYIDSNQEEEVRQKFKDEFKTGLDLNVINWNGDTQFAMIMNQKIPMLFSTKELDIIAIQTENYDRFAKIYGKDMFAPLEEIPELTDLLEKYKDHLYVCDKVRDEEGNEMTTEEHVLGIKVNRFNNIPCIIESEEMVIGINPMAKDFEKTINMLKYILE